MIFRTTRVALAGALVLAASTLAHGQLPGTPVLQNAWASPGIVVAVDFGGGSAGSGSAYAGAAAWTPAGGRLQLSAGAGVQSASGTSSRGVFGARLAVPLAQMMAGKLGAAAFIGVGGGSGNATDTVRARSIAPAGVAIGFRQPVGTSGRGFSFYADPNYQYQSGSKTKKGYMRVGFGLDAGITSRLGVTLGVESGATAAPGAVGPHGSLYGLGVSMKLGR